LVGFEKCTFSVKVRKIKMEIKSVFDQEFARYGQVKSNYDTDDLLAAMRKIPLPAEGTDYRSSIQELESQAAFHQFENNAYGGMPVQMGMCWGRNTKLNCLEYHRDNEFNIGADDFILLLAKRDEMQNDMLDTSKVKAFRIPAGVLVEVFADTLHYAPCHTDKEKGFRVAVVLPKGTNESKPAFAPISAEDRLLWARNKWLVAHADSLEAKQGAVIGLNGENIDVQNDI